MKNQKHVLLICLLAFFGISKTVAQTYNLVQTFENGGNGTDACWTGFSTSAIPSSNNFYITTIQIQSGISAAGMYACCGGAGSNAPTYYISPVLPVGEHTVTVFLRQSSQFNESFEIGQTNNTNGSIFNPVFTKSVWPFPVAWEKSVVVVSTTEDLNRIAFRVPAASTKTYFLDSIVISNSGNAIAACAYTLVTGLSLNLVENEKPMPFPNPFQSEISFPLVEGKEYELKLFDVNSKVVADQTISKEKPINLKSLKRGIYSFSLFGNTGFISKGRLIKD